MTKEDILAFYAFIDATLALPEELEIKYLGEIEQFEGEKAMAYITSAELADNKAVRRAK